VLYRRDDDTIHVVYDSAEAAGTIRSWYRRKRGGDGRWTAREELQASYRLADGRHQYFYYPKLAVFRDRIHVFTTANVFDPDHTDARFFNGIKQFYREYDGAGPWRSEWITGPLDPGRAAVLYDAYRTRDGALALVTSFSSGPSGNRARETPLFLSRTGAGDWTRRALLSHQNAQACVEQTADGTMHLFYGSPGSFAGYAQSDDGLAWRFFQVLPPADVGQRAGLGINCLSSAGSAPLARAAAIVTTIGRSQRVDYSRLPALRFPDGHSVVLVEIAGPG
jgi:hypothetical protein